MRLVCENIWKWFHKFLYYLRVQSSSSSSNHMLASYEVSLQYCEFLNSCWVPSRSASIHSFDTSCNFHKIFSSCWAPLRSLHLYFIFKSQCAAYCSCGLFVGQVFSVTFSLLSHPLSVISILLFGDLLADTARLLQENKWTFLSACVIATLTKTQES